MTAEIICVGTELLLGDIVNTNAQFLSRELAELGISVLHQHVIGDNPARLKELVLQAKSRSDLLVFSGGLGPTEDDLTKETVAEAFGDTLAFDEGEWQKIIDFFARTNRRPTPNNRKQAMCPTVGHKLINDHGTAPGAWFEDADGHCAALMPGVPREMKAMWAEQVRPILLKRQNCTIHSRTLRVLGGESAIASNNCIWLRNCCIILLYKSSFLLCIRCKKLLKFFLCTIIFCCIRIIKRCILLFRNNGYTLYLCLSIIRYCIIVCIRILCCYLCILCCVHNN